MSDPSRLIECPIEEATCVVNAQGEVFEVHKARGEYFNVPLKDGGHNSFTSIGLHNACLTPCKPKPVFVEAVSPYCIQGFAISTKDTSFACQDVGCAYFKTSDLAGIESIPTDQLEIVLRRKVSE